MKTTLQEIKEKLEGAPKEVDKGKGLALVFLATQIGRVATQLEILNEKFSKHKHKKE